MCHLDNAGPVLLENVAVPVGKLGLLPCMHNFRNLGMISLPSSRR
jgi:hypothetical protein